MSELTVYLVNFDIRFQNYSSILRDGSMFLYKYVRKTAKGHQSSVIQYIQLTGETRATMKFVVRFPFYILAANATAPNRVDV